MHSFSLDEKKPGKILSSSKPAKTLIKKKKKAAAKVG